MGRRVELTGLPLLLISCGVAIGALAALIAGWRRLRAWWLPVRIAGILLCEVLLLLSVALEVNRSGDFYPSWSALLGGAQSRDLPHAPAANLAPWLSRKAKQGAENGLVFTWKPTDAKSWQLGEAPIVYLPSTYFRRPALSLPVIVALAPSGARATQGAWDDRTVDTLARAAGVPSVLVFLRTGRHLRPDRLAAGLPARLAADLRVAPHGWGLVGIGTGVPTALQLFRSDPVRFGPLALVSSTAPPLSAKLLREARDAAGPQLLVAARGSVEPAPPTSDRRHGNPPLREPAGLTTVLRWAYGQLPPALAPPIVADVAPIASTTRPA